MSQSLVTTVIPVYDSDPCLVNRTLESLSRQTLDAGLMRIVIVDDASTKPGTLELLASLEEAGSFAGIPLKLIRHQRNQWLAQARVTGAHNADTPFILFLDSDDFVSADYLKKAVLLLVSNPRIGWVYPGTRCFGEYQEDRPPAPFRPFAFVLRNRTPYASVYRRSTWLEVSQRERRVVDGVRFFEDWDTTIRLMSRGHFGAPLADSTFYYNKRLNGLHNRTTKVYLLSIYMTWRANLLRLPLVFRSLIRHSRDRRKGTGAASLLNPVRLGDSLQRSILKRALETPEFNAVLDMPSLLASIVAPRLFVRRFLDPERSITLAETRCGFMRKPALPSSVDTRIGGELRPGTVLFAHTWWAIGGAENVLLEWLDAAKQLNVNRIIELTQLAEEENRDVREKFASISTEQHCLKRIGETPHERLMFCWNLICHERPKLIVVSGNAFLYALTPYIKREFPDTIIVDILHNEWRNRIDWFNVAHEYQESLDYRIVISNHWRDVLIDKYREHPEKIRVHPNFIDTARFHPGVDLSESKSAVALDPGKRVVTFIGRLHEQKHPEVFCELAMRFRERDDIQFVVVGDGPLHDTLTDTYDHLSNLQFRGKSLEIEKFMAASDLVVFCSRYEGSPLVSLEAAAMNKPIVAPDIVGFREQVKEGDFGLLYSPSGDPVHDAKQIGDIIDNRCEDLSSRGYGAHDFVVKHHSRHRLKPRQIDRLRELMGYTPRVTPVRPRQAKPPLYLHIGWTKTGSTSIQHFMYLNRNTLRGRDVLYPTYLSWGYAHHVLARFFAQDKQPDGIMKQFVTKEALEDRILRHIDSLAYNPYSRAVLSSETFRRSSPELVAKYLSSFDVKIVVFLRRQDEWVEAAANQRAKIKTKQFHLITGQNQQNRLLRTVPDYRGILMEWARFFGQENILVVPYERNNFPNGLERCFLETLDIEWSPELKRVDKRNRRLNRDSLAYINEYPQQVRGQDPTFHNIIRELEEFSMENPDPPELRYLLPPDVRREILDSCKENNDLIAKEFLKVSRSLFTEGKPSPTDPWRAYPGLSEEKRHEIGRFLTERGVAAA